ncbi:MAG: undecaprenyl diphosphate synthase family protein, partial [Archaeoglobaceae archaeon]
ESLLSLRSQPDLIVKAGKEIPDFLIWQSIYSELLFTDVDWGTIRYIDFLRIIREYQGRERRYGR